MLSGDNRHTAQTVADEVGITNVIAEVLPDQKADRIRELQTGGAKVAMVGDGINDAPALAISDVGIAMGGGTDIAIETSDVTITGTDLRGVTESIRLSQQTMRAVRQNLFWAFFYNLILIPVAAGALYPLFVDTDVPGYLQPLLGHHGFLNPVAAAAAMAFSSVSVVSNSLRLRKGGWRRDRRSEQPPGSQPLPIGASA